MELCQHQCKTDAQNHQQLCLSPLKIIEHLTQIDQERDLAKRSVPKQLLGPFSFVLLTAFGGTWAIVHAILDPAGPQVGPKI